ncbi:sel1 repeat family protein [Campylobacter sp. MIT 99-7217]|uniref:tetratricopeptide repeat protein n=1 Tax=Campylobacter sp. MIT 99-7217 TaxID=535091 RepID=UPI0011587F64|nr:tetratricopeptide repeat protein [Campylobacter sp. MIT 99-7217]TQR32410.1 sel1 repeat family protein [Campylobacter sp. MIT 99-7217]
MKKIFFLSVFTSILFAAVVNLDEGLKAYENKNYNKALSIFNELCKKNSSAKACYSIAFMFENGEGVDQDNEQAKSYYKLACQNKLSSACFNLALLMIEDEDDENETNLTLYRACSLSHSLACERLGIIYEAKKDGDLAVEFYTRACQLKNAPACFRLGDLYKKGSLVKQNTRTAIRTYENACELKFGEACYVVGRYHQEEKKDNTLAKRYLGKACDLNHLEACEAYKQINTAADTR